MNETGSPDFLVKRVKNTAGFPNPWRILKETVRQFITVQGPFLASGLAFELLIYCIPLFFLLISVLGFILSGPEQIEMTKDILTKSAPGAHQIITENLSMIIASRNQTGLIGFILFITFSMTMFGSARTALNTVMGVEYSRNFFVGKGIDLLMSMFVAVLLGITIGMLSLLTMLRGVTDQIFLTGAILRTGGMMISEVLGFLFTLVLFFVLYRFCPARTLTRNALYTASLAGAVLFEVSKWVFALYASRAQHFALVHGTLSGLLFFLLWVYYACGVFLFSGAIGWAVDRELGTADPQ